MALAPGTRLGVYEVTALLGEGGMGQVYRATDTKLKRQVAIKILPPSLAADADRLARFQREAEVLASLNPPNIAGIYGLEEGDGITALVMELVDGEELADRIARGPIPLDEALPIATQIAEALEAAHEQGIIHRDLKPANIKVRSDGTVKVLDFGLDALWQGAPAPIPALVDVVARAPAVVFGLTAAQQSAMAARFPFLVRTTIAAHTYAGQPTPMLSVGAWNFVLAHKDFSEDAAYRITRAVLSATDPSQQIGPSAVGTRAQNVPTNSFMPFHAGAARFYREHAVTAK